MKERKEKMKIRKVFLVFCMLGMASSSNAQSIRQIEKTKSTGTEFIRKTGNNTFEMLPAGVVSYKIENNKLWALFSGIPEETGARGSYKKLSDRTNFYNASGDIVGYYIPKQGRFMTVSGSGDKIGKEDSYAVLIDGVLYVTSDNGTKNYTIDPTMDIEIIGFYLFVL